MKSAESVERWQIQQDFVARGLRAAEESRQSKSYSCAEAVLERLQLKLTLAKANLKSTNPR